MATISLCMIVRDEEAVLERCLDSVGDAVDEIVIVDTGSVDRTKEIAGKYTSKVYEFPWQDDFAKARNFALDRGNGDYLMWLDADDVLPEESREALIRRKEMLEPDTNLVMMPYQVAFDGKGRCTFSYWRERLIRQGSGLRFQGRVHEAVVPAGKLVYAEIPIKHCRVKTGESNRNLRIYETMEQAGEAFDARALYYYGRELLHHGHWKKACSILEEFLNRPDAWLENRIDGARQLAQARHYLGDRPGELRALLQTLEYDVPRGETCCSLGRFFLDQNAYEQAAYWYTQALQAKRAEQEGAFIQEECYGYLPAIMLCVCYDRMGRRDEAERFNALAGTYQPDSEAYRKNLAYFQSVKQHSFLYDCNSQE